MHVLLLFYSLVCLALLTYYAATLYKAYDNLQKSIEDSKSGIDSTQKETTKISIIIPVRNEADNIEDCLKSILANQYPSDLYQIIVVDDHSTDTTSELVSKYASVQYILNEGIGKKQALAHAISMAENELILCTDGDTTVGSQWISQHVISSRDHSFSTGIVKYKADINTLGSLQIHDNAATMCLTSYGINTQKWHVANGANMSFSKSLYASAGGHKENQHIPSGDDVFLIKKGREMNVSIGFINSMDGAVLTQAESRWSSFWEQRQRWSSKTMIVKDTHLVIFQAVTFAISLLILGGFMGGIMLSSFFVVAALILYMIKLTLDFMFLRSTHNWIGYAAGHFKYFIWTSFVYLWYIVLIGLVALFPIRYRWKGRQMA